MVMNPTRTIRCLGQILAGLAATLLASIATTSVAFAAASVGPAGPAAAPVSTPSVFRVPPGWNKHPPLPGSSRIHAALPGGMPGWQITLIAAVAAILAVTLTVLLTRARAARRRTLPEDTPRYNHDGPAPQPASSTIQAAPAAKAR
jgi:hypothetical protein